MNKSAKVTIILCAILAFVLVFAGCARQQPEERAETGRTRDVPAVKTSGGPTEINSEHGKIEDGAKAFSPDGKYYLQEISPDGKNYGFGKIGVYENGTGTTIVEWDVLKGGKNDIKALAWLRTGDPKLVMVMYHGGTKPGITVYDVGKNEETGSIETTEYYHFVKFTAPDTISVSEKGDKWEDLKIKPVSAISGDAARPDNKVEADAGKPKTDGTTGVPGRETGTDVNKPAETGTETAGGETIVIKGESKPFSYPRTDAIGSEHGEINPKDKAYSKDRNIYICAKLVGEEANKQGIIDIYRKGNNGEYSFVKSIKFYTGDSKNPLKGFALSPDARKIAVLFNYSDYNEVIVGDIATGNIIGGEKQNLPVEKLDFLHFVCFSKDGRKILLAASKNSPVIALELEGLQ